jgi:photosystem I P700 chlorophyll a apoprotein A1
MYNSLSIAIFHFSWKMQSDVWGTVNASGISHITGGNFAQSANTINGWLRDFLWAQSSQVIQSYGSVSVWFNFLRRSLYLGIQSYVLIQWSWLLARINQFMHKVKSAPAIQPRALSITQGRAVGVAHYLLVVLQQLFFEARIISVG